MGIFTPTGYSLKYNLLHPHKVIAHKCRDISCAWQRATKGYCYRDLWDIDLWFLELMPKMLEEFNKNRHGYPGTITEEEWEEIIKKMIECFRNANEHTTEFVNPYEDEYLKTLSFDFEDKNNQLKCSASEELKRNYREAEIEKDRKMKESYEQGMELFKRWLPNLWD